MRAKRIARVQSKVEVRDRLLVLSKGFNAWEMAIPETSTEEGNHANKTMPSAQHADAKTCAELQTSIELSALKTPPQAHGQLLKSPGRSKACRVLDPCLSAADVTSPEKASSGMASAELVAKMHFSPGFDKMAPSPVVTGKESEFGSKRSPTSSSTSLVASGSLYSSMSEAGENRSVSSSCMRSSRSTRSSVWVCFQLTTTCPPHKPHCPCARTHTYACTCRTRT